VFGDGEEVARREVAAEVSKQAELRSALLLAGQPPIIGWRDTSNLAAASVTVNPSTCTANTA
jgi:hypothetical protein